MTPGARIAAVIELTGLIEAAPPPADAVVERFFRERRYMGSKDRRAVADMTFAMVRSRARLAWWIGRAGASPGASPRNSVLAHCVLFAGTSADDVAALFSGERHCPEPLSDGEKTLVTQLAGQPADHPEMPPATALELPEWLDEPLRQRWGTSLAVEMAALNRPAPVDLRVNTARSTREKAQSVLAADGIEAVPTPLSPIGLRIDGRPNLRAARAFRDGLVEVQDEGAQVAALLAGTSPGMTVVDFCAGAGGKTLAMAATMIGTGRVRGRLIACDVLRGPLRRMEKRLARARIAGVESRFLAAGNDPWVAANQGKADRVLADVPCSGTGTWRRHPDIRWRLRAADVDEYVGRQRRILTDAAGLVRRGGRLIYVTCSLLRAENEEQIDRFVEERSDFSVVPLSDAWTERLGDTCPAAGPCLTLSPAATGTDGFFVAVLERR